MCRADQVSINKELGLAGKHKDEFIPRWIKRELQKQKSSYCVPGCAMVAEHTCVFAVTRLTQSCNEKLGRKQSDCHLHERKVQVAYIVCVILFCATGGRCSVPLHTLAPD